MTVFKYLPDGTGAYHDMWLRRKSNLIDVREMSTLRAFAELAVLKEDLQKDWLLDPAEYALSLIHIYICPFFSGK